MKKGEEALLYEPIGSFFKCYGYFVFGTLRVPQFGVVLPTGAIRRPDIVAVRWDFRNVIHCIAVECKSGNARDAVADALGQACDYQMFFDEVYIATKANTLGDRANVLKSLGLGHLAVEGDDVSVKLPAEVRSGGRFDEEMHYRLVRPRIVIPLVFQDLFGEVIQQELPLRCMSWGYEEGYVSQDLNKEKLQYNCGYRQQKTRFGINVEFKPAWKKILANLNRAKFAKALAGLPDSYVLQAHYDSIPRRELPSPPQIGSVAEAAEKQANTVDGSQLLKDIEEWTGKPEESQWHVHQWERHLNIGRAIWNDSEVISNKTEYIDRAKAARDRLREVEGILQEAFAETA